MRMPKQHAKTSPNMSNMTPKTDPGQGYVGLGNALGRVQERRKSDTENHTEKNTPKTA